MISFSNNNISVANTGDALAITKLLNSAYRGEASQQGWTTEAHLIAGDVRTNAKEVEALMLQENSVFLKFVVGEILGCINLQKHNEKIYLGMLSVAPNQQGTGIGKKLLQAADEYAKHFGCKSIYMTVVSVRTELIDWYKRHGFADTGTRTPFEEDGISGKHLQQLEFAILEKTIK
jgi:ribosomal protein S18 acetylase RimI-like enzyme